MLANFSGPWPRTKILNWWDVRLNFVLPNISLTIIASIAPRVQRIVPSMVESTESTASLLLRANRWWFGYHWFTWYRGIVTILWWVREIICRVNLDERVLGVKDPLLRYYKTTFWQCSKLIRHKNGFGAYFNCHSGHLYYFVHIYRMKYMKYIFVTSNERMCKLATKVTLYS